MMPPNLSHSPSPHGAAGHGGSAFADGAPVRTAGGAAAAGSYGDGSTTGKPRLEGFADGLGPTMPPIQPSPEPNSPPPSKLRSMVEGPRGLSVRTTVYLRYIGYMFVIVFGSAVSHWCFSQTAWWAGGYVMFAGSVLMTVTAAVGTWFFTNNRHEVIEQFKHYTIGIAVIPGTAIAVVNWTAQGLFHGPMAQTDAFMSAMGSALPILYFVTVVVPSVIFIKVVAGLRTIHRSRLDDQEAWEAYSRIDKLQR